MATASVTVPSPAQERQTAPRPAQLVSAEPLIMLATVTTIRYGSYDATAAAARRLSMASRLTLGVTLGERRSNDSGRLNSGWMRPHAGAAVGPTAAQGPGGGLAIVLHGKVGGMESLATPGGRTRAVDGARASAPMMALCYASLLQHVVQPNQRRGTHVDIFGHSWSPEVGAELDAMYRPLRSSHEPVVRNLACPSQKNFRPKESALYPNPLTPTSTPTLQP